MISRLNDLVIVVKKQMGIPCMQCDSWKKKERKFSCNPNDCKVLTEWLLGHAPVLTKDTVQMQVHLPDVAIRYVV
jgi:hypothetical protein